MNLRALWAGIALVFLSISAMAQPSKMDWKEVDNAVAKGLPKTAIEKLEPMIPAAIAEKKYAFAIRALVRKIDLEGEIQGNGAEEKITRLEAELPRMPSEMHPLLQTVVADWYWQYFQENRWKFAQRTQQSGAVSGGDIRTWDLTRILSEIDLRFTAALSAQETLKKIPIGEYSDLLEAGTAPDDYRPTLYDFIAHEALSFYQAGEQAGVKAESEFEIEARGPIFDDVANFTVWKPESSSANAALKAIRLYQQLMVFHANDASALADLDLSRIIYGFATAAGEDRSDRYVAALERIVSKHPKEEFAARSLARLSDVAASKSDFVQAHRLAERGAAIPVSGVGVLECKSRIEQLESKTLSVESESVWTAPWPKLAVQYRNLNKIYFRVVALDFDSAFARSRWNLRLSDEDTETVLTKKPVLSWDADLNDPRDYAEHTAKLDVPSGLRPGFYAVLASANPDFSEEKNWMSLATVWVSDLALVQRKEANGIGGFVLRAGDGSPVANARVRTFVFNRGGTPSASRTVATDADGRFQTSANDEQVFLVAEKDGQRISSLNYSYSFNRQDESKEQYRTVFFLDRAIYRPGQTIHFKGITLLGVPQEKFKPVAKKTLVVVFYDANNQEISRVSLVTNEFGSFSGVFTAPRDRLTGAMSLRVEENGVASFRVEEYKRPKFQVALKAPAAAPKLGEEVVVRGDATAYTGASVGGARVAWRVERGVSWPAWFWWSETIPAKAIAHGTAVTNSDGTFSLSFPAEPDRSVSIQNDPSFTYHIYADVTDISGETRSADRVVTAGYTALRLEANTAEWLDADTETKLILTATSLDREPASAEGEIKIYDLKQPQKVERPDLSSRRYWFRGTSLTGSAVEEWESGRLLETKSFRTGKDGMTVVAVTLPAGIYRAEVISKDRFGKTVTARKTLQVIDSKGTRLPIKVPEAFLARSWSIQPGNTFSAIWGTGYPFGRAFVEISCGDRILQKYWTDADRTLVLISQPVTEDMRGGFTVRTTFLEENRLYVNERTVDVPWTNKDLHLSWETFRSKLEPGSRETWSLRVAGTDSKKTSAELVATLYDASLDQFASNRWPSGFAVFRNEESRFGNTELQNMKSSFDQLSSWPQNTVAVPIWSYRHFPETLANDERIVLSPFLVTSSEDKEYKATSTLAGSRLSKRMMGSAAASELRDQASLGMPKASGGLAPSDVFFGEGAGLPVTKPPQNLDQISARKNLTETAFFYPQLLTDSDGVVKIQFTMPEALTKWKFLGFAHDRELRSGVLTDTVVTSKDLMVEPNPPRFVREGDVIEFNVKVSNQSDVEQTGSVQLALAEASSLRSVDQEVQNLHPQQTFTIPAKQSRSFVWRISIPDGLGFLTYKTVAAAGRMSDGEEGYLPVLSRRVLVTESLPISVRNAGTKTFSFEKLISSGSSPTLKNQALTVQMTSQPAWNAVLALPYLMEYPYECSEQLFNRFYANSLAATIANSDPRIRRVFEQWKNTPALKSPLEKNADLKPVALEETPWVFAAQAESTARQYVGLLFDANRLNDESDRALKKLVERQGSDGLWSWFPGGPTSEYISLYIVSGFGRLRHLGAKIDVVPAIRALGGLDDLMEKRYREILKGVRPDEYQPGSFDLFYLYGRSFFLVDQPVDATHQEALTFFEKQARQFWLKVTSRQSQAQLAVALQRFGDAQTPAAIMASLKERSLRSDEEGMYWREPQTMCWFWAQAPIETQAMMIEAFDEVAHDQSAVEDCRIWLLQQKRAENWKTTKATADAVYALLLRGSSLLGEQRVDVDLGGKSITPEKVEAGTGYYEQKFVRDEIKPEMGTIRVTKKDAGLSWGSVTWQYLGDISKVSSASTSDGLGVKKSLFVKSNTAQGQTLTAVR
ncbi:MAG TPA: alpha-2-macroglobulin family protein, partial [Opitutaceae bacterium]